jgi:hypothetical protein
VSMWKGGEGQLEGKEEGGVGAGGGGEDREVGTAGAGRGQGRATAAFTCNASFTAGADMPCSIGLTSEGCRLLWCWRLPPGMRPRGARRATSSPATARPPPRAPPPPPAAGAARAAEEEEQGQLRGNSPNPLRVCGPGRAPAPPLRAPRGITPPRTRPWYMEVMSCFGQPPKGETIAKPMGCRFSKPTKI